MNRRKQIEVLGFTLTAISGMPGEYMLLTDDVQIHASHLFHRTPELARWALSLRTGEHRVAADAVTMAAACSKLSDAMLANSYVYRAVKSARRAA